ncbi:hypothetical protein ABZ832_02755 [Streptantibioticus parmotrematis]|uniref:hypothetical protein n=1 Tax=Streptantibioticus parmotrematis TaxID=2873249 RepID=UPI0033CDB4C6
MTSPDDETRREPRFEPASLVAGLLFLGIAAAFGCDAAGLWHPETWLLAPTLGIGLALTGATTAATEAVRERRRRKRS